MVVWSRAALNDLQKIYLYIKEGSYQYAEKVRAEFFELADELILFPRVGKMVSEEQDPALRERLLYSYRMIYEINETQIQILAIVHNKQLLQNKKTGRN